LQWSDDARSLSPCGKHGFQGVDFSRIHKGRKLVATKDGLKSVLILVLSLRQMQHLTRNL
jgi:hypothetical protein